MRKKLTLLFALLCVSVMGWAADYCNAAITSEGGRNATVTMRLVSGTTYEFSITTVDNITSYSSVSLWLHRNGSETYNFGNDISRDGNTLSVQFTSSSVPSIYSNALFISLDGYGENRFNIPTDASWAACSSKPSPELSLNATSITLEKDVTAETFQIVPTKAEGSGAISYSSNATDVATVSETGLVTAVGNGTATITVSVAENASYAAESKTLTVEVIDWPSIAWLTNSNNTYKLHISPNFSDDYGGKRLDGSNLWIGFPSADFGVCSIEPSGGSGAWKTFALSNFPGYRSQFTVVCSGTTYTFTVYRVFDGVNLAKNMPCEAGHSATPKAEANDGNKGSRWGSENGKHYAQYGDMAEDWWYVDLGAFYEVSSIKTLYQTACPTDYDLLTSPNGDSWVSIGSYNATPKTGQTDADYNEYSFSPGKVARYVKIFARNGYNNLQYGISIWEFEVYGQPAEGYDVNNPTLISATLSGTPTSSQVQIAVSATDAEGAVTTYRVKDISNGVDRNCTIAAGVITINGLSEGTNYSFTVTALDAIGNQSNAIVVAASTTADPTIPQVAAPTPDGSGKDVLAIYSDVFPNILAHAFDKDGWEGAHVLVEKDFSANKCLVYDMSSTKFTTWGMYDDGGNAIIAATGYSDPDNATHKGVDASGMDKLHIDIWSLQACNNINLQINDQGRGALRLSHSGEGWQSYDIDLTDFEVAGDENKRTNNVRWFKFLDFSTVTGKIAIDNVYFWKPSSSNKSVSVSVNNGSMGSATAKVGDDDVTLVANGTEVTFRATPNSGYDFVNWTKGGVEVSTSATYALEITENTVLVANFELHREVYCHTAVLTNDNAKTMYLTCSKVADNTYKIHVDGTAQTPIDSRYNYDFAITGAGVTYDVANWTTDNTGYGSAEVTFTATDISAITIPNKYLCFNKQGGGLIEFGANIPAPNTIAWKNICSDATAPVLTAPSATALNSTDVRLTLSATDNWNGTITYNISYKPTGDAGAGTNVTPAPTGDSGETITHDITGLTSGVEYTFTVTATDENSNTSAAQNCSATPVEDAEAPVITSFIATASYGYIDLAMTATDDMVGDLTYTITYGETEENVVGAAGSETTKRIYALPNTALSFSVVATDAASHTSAAALANAKTLTIPAAPAPTHNAAAVRSVYSDAYSPSVASSFWRANFGSPAPIAETDNILYRMTANVIVWGHNSATAGAGNIDGSSGYTYGENTGLDVSGMKYIHFDVFCDADNQLNTVNINDQPIAIPSTRTVAGEWVSFEVDITGVALADRQNVRWLKFHPFSTTNCNVAIDNVYFYKDPELVRDDDWMAPGELGTICIPQGAVATGGDLYELVGMNDIGKIIFATVPGNEMEPGKPYLFEAKSNAMKFYYTEETPAVEPDNSGAMKGSFTSYTLYDLDNVYYFAGHALWSCDDLTELNVIANRAYVKLDEVVEISPAPVPGRRFVYMDVHGPNTTTGVDELNASETPVKVIIDGKLFILRGEKMYDVTGSLVK